MHALVVLLGFFSGIALASLLPLSWLGSLFLLFLSCVFFVLARFKKGRAYILAGLFLLGASAGALRTEFSREELPPEFAEMLGERVTLEGKVVTDPDVRETTVRLTLLVEAENAHTKVLAVVPVFPEVRYGQTVRVEGVLKQPEAFGTDGGRVFRYDQFLAKDGIFAMVQNGSLEIISERHGASDTIFGFFSDLKRSGIDALAVALPEPHASLASGLILGGKQGLGEELLDAFILTGLVHIVVLSGYNVMIVAEAVFRTFALFAKRYSALVAGMVITAFVLTAGAGAASIRAGIMAGIALFGRATGRTYDACRALLVAGALMLLWNPLLLLYDPGFQLSFIATLGLIFGAPITEHWVKFIRIRFLREIVSATIAAQIAVLPLLLYQNGLFSLVSLPANALVLPFVPLAMALGALAGLCGFLVPAIAPFAGLPAYAILSIIIGATEFFASLPMASLSVPAFPFALVILSYGALAFFVRRTAKPSRPK